MMMIWQITVRLSRKGLPAVKMADLAALQAQILAKRLQIEAQLNSQSNSTVDSINNVATPPTSAASAAAPLDVRAKVEAALQVTSLTVLPHEDQSAWRVRVHDSYLTEISVVSVPQASQRLSTLLGTASAGSAAPIKTKFEDEIEINDSPNRFILTKRQTHEDVGVCMRVTGG